MIEVVIALGIIAVAVIPLVGSLVLAYEADKTAKENTELALVAQSCKALLRGTKPAILKSQLTTAPATFYFANGGGYLGTTTNSADFYRCSISLNTNAPQSSQRVNVLMKIDYPAPAYNQSFTSPTGVFNYGANLP